MVIGVLGASGAASVTMGDEISEEDIVPILHQRLEDWNVRVNLMSTDHAMELVMEDTNVVQHPIHVMLVRETVTVILIVKEIWCVDQIIAKWNGILHYGNHPGYK